MAASSGSFERSLFEREVVERAAGGLMRLRLGHDFAMVRAARRAVGRWLDQRGCRTADDAVLVLSELVTNAMVHAGAGCTIEMQHSDDRLRLEVRDRSPKAPVIGVGSPRDVGGEACALLMLSPKRGVGSPRSTANVFGPLSTPRSIVPAAMTASRSRPPPDTPAVATPSSQLVLVFEFGTTERAPTCCHRGRVTPSGTTPGGSVSRTSPHRQRRHCYGRSGPVGTSDVGLYRWWCQGDGYSVFNSEDMSRRDRLVAPGFRAREGGDVSAVGPVGHCQSPVAGRPCGRSAGGSARHRRRRPVDRGDSTA